MIHPVLSAARVRVFCRHTSRNELTAIAVTICRQYQRRWRPYRNCSARSPSTASLLGLHPKCSSSQDRKSTRLNSSHQIISYAVFCLKKKKRHPQAERKLG